METKIKCRLIRLAPRGDSGRVRWCIGSERAWNLKLKILVFVPIVLLLIVASAILSTRYVPNSPINETFQTHPHSYRSDKSNILGNIKVSYVTQSALLTQLASTPGQGLKQKRELLINTHPDNVNNIEKWYPEDVSRTQFGHGLGYSTVPDLKGNLSYDARYLERASFWKDQVTQIEIRQTQATLMQKYMDTTIDPCNDFYHYACGNWEKGNKIPPDKTGYDTFEILRQNLDVVLRDLLSEDIEPTVHSDRNLDSFLHRDIPNSRDFFASGMDDAVTKAKLMYRSCLNEGLINKRGAEPLLNLLKYWGGWPALDPNWKETDFDWIGLIARLKTFNSDVLLKVGVGPDVKNSAEHILQLNQATLGLPSRDYFLQESNRKYLEAYRIYMITVLNLLGAPILRATRNVDETIDFETSLAHIMKEDRNQNVPDTFVRTTLGDLQSTVPQIDIVRYLRLVREGQEIASTEPVVCFSIGYLQGLVGLLGKTEPRTITNYILWRFVWHRVNNLDGRFLQAKQRFRFILFGQESSPPRWQKCVAEINSNMGMALGNLFVRKYFDDNSKNDTLRMTRAIQRAFQQLLLNKPWLDNETKLLARLKLEAMGLKIGYPEFLLDKRQLAEMYSDVEININRYFENTLSVMRHKTRLEQKEMGLVVDRLLWNTPPGIVNAYYSRSRNQIIFPAGILQPPFYHKYFPRALNYGGIGVVMGHEITHGFDDKGRLFDRDGNMQRWWRDRSVAEFDKRAHCLIEQYNSFIVPNIRAHVNGWSTQGENIADNGGIKQTYSAYKDWLNENPRVDEGLPGMNLTHSQLFFLHFAQMWCGDYHQEVTRHKIKTAVHSPGLFRVVGTLSNSAEFSESYNCPLGSPMNPKRKCVVW